ncbi:hypothetical protein L3H50_04780 [Corynebacterium sp. MC-04]|uniref:Alcohol dehydrogenase-like C-terminal domain-containing protein n=1 Tax=Corynebacterium parakroppenstedtii TaxID=2828363 RepID=A0ABS9HJ49_9CORY|nr:hypothetical protein [Corynebacterium parakroppenstedtii]MDU3198101.1 hypothetical protein [Corynebacterium kroppenstedtii]MBY0789017.1 hypothetical protein [Corynebacterium parakroppenstedtii]MBY0793080.1 hypothetical protein [Corynebacterium parakroppenstedtii]MBY0795615.1 hypothetical protein [Corynebacterium parakroppenstedtii]MBY0797678.1 hypothetical protein [Corynebacterium parakroppenstedtii]
MTISGATGDLRNMQWWPGAPAIIPDHVSFASAAVVPFASLTACQAIERKSQVASSDTVTITGAGVGGESFAIQIAVNRGSHVVGVALGRCEDRVRSSVLTNF